MYISAVAAKVLLCVDINVGNFINADNISFTIHSIHIAEKNILFFFKLKKLYSARLRI